MVRLPFFCPHFCGRISECLSLILTSQSAGVGSLRTFDPTQSCFAPDSFASIRNNLGSLGQLTFNGQRELNVNTAEPIQPNPHVRVSETLTANPLVAA